ncbi:MAG: aminotransferase class V-fold PLP-dependent enzyme [Oscillospiraceae bacterium]|nr:aminotransferase class V-fold PLP-dependent enzyme [Oscillospiraceae bacterium]
MEIYADNAATTKISDIAKAAMIECMESSFGNPSSLHSDGQRAAVTLASARRKMAQQLGCSEREVIFTSGGTEADNQAIFSAAALGEKAGKKHIVSSAAEHHAVLHALHRLEKQGFEVTLLPMPESGVLSPKAVETVLRDDTCLVTIMMANNEIGTIQPIAEIGNICRERGVLLHTDAVAASGYVPIDVVRQKIDMLSLSAHKFHGPKGVGMLYARKGIKILSLVEGGSQEGGKRAGTENLPGIVGMATAFEQVCANMRESAAKLTILRDRLIDGLGKIPHSVLNGDKLARLPSNANFCFEAIEGESLLLLLDQKGIRASSGSACTSGSLEPSHVLLSIGRSHEVAHGSLRLTLDHTATEQEVDYMIEATYQVVARLREMSPVWRDLQEGKRKYVI